jgi:ABC-type branched-subunit amino acid transport system permease subunit
MTSSRRTTLGLGLALLALGLLAPVLPKWALFLVTIAIGKGLTALGLLLLMRTGLVSFGQGLYFATGAYAAGVASDALHVGDAVLMVLLGGLAAALVAAVLGLLLARYRAIFFAMLSLAFSMILYGLLVKSSALGSTDGFNVAPRTVFGVAGAPWGDTASTPSPRWWPSARPSGSIATSGPTWGGWRRRSATTSFASSTWAPRSGTSST